MTSLLTAALLGLTACTPNGTPSGQDDAKSKTFVMALASIPDSLDGERGEVAPTYRVWAATLVDRFEDDNGVTTIEPALAESWTENEDGSYTFVLSPAVSYHGNQITSEDVKWSLERAIETDSVVKALFGYADVDIENPVTLIDEGTFTLNLKRPNAIALMVLAIQRMMILDTTEILKHTTGDDPWGKEWLATNTATFGPYGLSALTPGQQVTLEANPNWIGGEIYFDKIILREVPNSSTRLQLLQKGEADYTLGLSLSDLKTASESEGVVTYESDIPSLDYLRLNLTFAPFQDARVRHAMAIALDRDAIVKAAYAGVGEPALFQIPKMQWSGFLSQDPGTPYIQDVDKARALLAEAGYADGFAFELATNSVRPGPQSASAAVLIQEQLQKVGITVTIQPIAAIANFMEGRQKGTYTAWIDQLVPQVPDVGYTTTLLYGGLVKKVGSYENAQLDAMLPDLWLPGPDRNDRLAEIMTILQRDVPSIPLVVQRGGAVMGADIDGWDKVPGNEYLYPVVLSRK